MSWKATVDQSHLQDSAIPMCHWPSDSTAKPVHIQRVEKALNLEPLLSYIEALRKPRNQCVSEVDEDVDLDASNIKCFKDCDGNKVYNGVVISRAEQKSDKSRLYNFSRIKKTRKWLKAVLLSDTSSDDEDEEEISSNGNSLSTMLMEHLYRKRCQNQYQRDRELKQYQYYSVGLLSNYDKFYDHQKAVAGPKKKLYQEKKLEKKRLKEKLKKLKEESKDDDVKSEIKEEDLSEGEGGKAALQPQANQSTGKAAKSKIKKLSPEQIAARRRKIWVLIAKKEIPRAHRQKTAYRKEVLAGVRKVAKECQKECRKGAILSQKMMKEANTRTRRLSKEMQAYWKRFEKVEKEHRRRAEKEALEQRKMDIELREMKRQQRKLNFLITQTELYAHFMARKLTGGSDVERDAILSSFDEEKLVTQHQVDGGLLKDVEDDEYDAEEMKAITLSNAEEAYRCHQNIKKSFDAEFRNRQRRLCDTEHQLMALSSLCEGKDLLKVCTQEMSQRRLVGDQTVLQESVFANPSIATNTEWPQPAMFEGKLKGYQLKGMNWLANLYDQGINGILADEMGLGKTVQSIAFLAHLAESQSIWGPFLIIAPASTLHNWQQEVTRFVPQFKVVPYWGNTQDRKTLRKFWNKKHIHMKEASFHIVITSYQLIVQDAKYFQQIEWHYMILDEAQAIKSSASSRWKSLLVFKCRNRLLLTGTPIQNSMAELWALLHFIMPTLFDSHDEFNEWFSKDIENHVEKQSNLDKNQLGRLHMILKPFMLRRVKKDVENELSDKIEILYYCPLTMRQKMLYQAIKNKISIEDLLRSSSVTSSQSTSSLMNLVMQFRKVCNHPELFERRDIKSPFHMKLPDYYYPKLVYREGFSRCAELHQSDAFIRNLCIFHPMHVHRSLFPKDDDSESRGHLQSCFSFTRFIDMSPAELNSVMVEGLLLRCMLLYKWIQRSFLLRIHRLYHTDTESTRVLGNKCLLLERDLQIPSFCDSANLTDLIFTLPGSRTYAHANHFIRSARNAQGLRTTRPIKTQESDSLISSLGNDSSPEDSSVLTDPSPAKFDPHLEDAADSLSSGCLRVHHCVATDVPRFLYYCVPKVVAGSFGCYTIDRSAEWQRMWEAINASTAGHKYLSYGFQAIADEVTGSSVQTRLFPAAPVGIQDVASKHGFSNICIPDKETIVVDAGKLTVLDRLLTKLKKENHRILIYSQMTRMIDILEEYLWYRKHTYMRLDGSSKISDRRDMVADFQTRSDIFVFLLSTRAGGLGINLTAADTVIFYDSDWNPTVDQQAMDRAHRLGQTKQVTVYRLICKGTIEERILQRAKEKSEIQRMVITGGNFSPDILKAKEVVSLLLDDDEMERKLQHKQDERKQKEELNKEKDMQRKRKQNSSKPKSGRGPGRPPKRPKVEDSAAAVAVAAAAPTFTENFTIPAGDESSQISINSASAPPSPRSECLSVISEVTQKSESMADDESCDGVLVVDDVTDHPSSSSVSATSFHSKRGGRPRGRPRGSGTTHRSRGRGSIQKSLSAAEAAAAVAAKKAAYAAYGYSFTDNPSPGSAHLGMNNMNCSSSLAASVHKSTDSSTNGCFQL